MAIKRYIPKYKILAKLRYALWLEKRRKINQFARQKWDGKKKFYFPRKAKIFDQDSATYPVGFDFESDRAVRLKKTYKYLLQDKQAFQLYYGARRLKFYQLKQIGMNAKKWGRKKSISSARVFFHLMENRLEVSLYRLGFVSTLMQARRLLTMSKVRVDADFVKSFGYHLKQNNTIKLENLKSIEILARYLKFNVPFFYFQNRGDRKHGLYLRKEFAKNSFLNKYNLAVLHYVKTTLVRAQELRKKIIK